MSQRGQASVEYVAVIALVAVMVVGTAIAVGAPGLRDAVVAGFRHALCVVTGAACRDDLGPCTVASTEVRDRGEASALVVRAGRDHAVLRERRSDGSVLITVIDSEDGGVGGELGLGAELRLGRSQMGLKGALRGALVAEVGGGRTWVARDGAEADRIVEALGEDGKLRWVTVGARRLGEALGLRKAPEPAEVFLQGGGRALAEAELSSDLGDVQLSGTLDRAGGVRVDRRTGERTFYLRDAAAGDARLTSRLADGAVSRAGESRLAYTVDARGRPRSFSILGAWSEGDGEARERRTESEVTIDLRGDPRLQALARQAMVDTLPSRVAVLRRLAGLGRLDRRVYDTAVDERGFGGSVTIGLRLGADGTRTTSTAALVDASTRLPDGLTVRRDDCLAGA
jgi:Flp pilus assembly pilin Flp